MRHALWPVPVLVFLVVWGLTTHGKYSVSGDEPHYLLIAESLRADGDIDLANDYASGVSARFGHDDLELGEHARRDSRGALTSVHEPGLAVLVLPAYVTARRVAERVPAEWLRRARMTEGLFVYSLVSLFLLGVACGALYLLLATLASLGPPLHARAAVLVAGLSPPVLSNAFLVFPEVPALFVTSLGLWSSYGPGRRQRWTLCAAAAAMGLLPWFHRKFTLYAVGLLLVLVWSRRDELLAGSRRRLMLLVGAFAVPVVAFYAFSWDRWGTLAGPVALDRVPLSWTAFRAGGPGQLLDRENGLLVWAPVYATVFAAAWFTGRRAWLLAVPAVLLFVPNAAHDLWWGGFAPAARFLLPLTPLMVFVMARALDAPAYARSLAAACGLQLVISALAWQQPRSLWPLGDGHNRILESLPVVGTTLSQALPAFRVGEASLPKVLAWCAALAAVNVLLATRMAAFRRPGRGEAGRVAGA